MPLLVLNNIEKFYKKLRISISSLIAIHYYKIDSQYLSMTDWKSSEGTPLSIIFGRDIPMWSDKDKSPYYKDQTILFIINCVTYRINNGQIGLDLSKKEQPYYILLSIKPIIYNSKQTFYLKKFIQLQRRYKIGYVKSEN